MGGGSFDHDKPVDPVPVDADVAGVDWMGEGVDLTMAVAGLTEGAGVTDLTEGAGVTDLTEGAGTDLRVGLADDWFATKPSVCTKSKTSTPRKTAMMISDFCLCILLFGRKYT
jgi:hypothetical protein